MALIERERFMNEFNRLKNVQYSDSTSKWTIPVCKGTPFDALHPFRNDEGIIQLGGRLKKSALAYGQKYPMLLPSKYHVTVLIIRHRHLSTLYSEIQSTLYFLRDQFLILNGKNQVRHMIRHCVECFPNSPRPTHAQMADFPKARVNETLVFCHTGVDFFGPIRIKEKKFRNKVILKTYGCVFICMASKAVHIELATDLSTKGFLICLRRFFSHRGIPERVYPYNGTNFLGAAKELREIYDLFETPQFRDSIKSYSMSIDWQFNPPVSPHFGGLWEAAVKSFKHDLKCVVKDQVLIYEQINTLLIEIEAVLNSSSLYALSSDPTY